ncbi:MAG: hypothetical protein SPH34_00015 [Lachnospiraceae bacterium]|jgi:uncharacterized membrane protein YccC|uniref:hypothetical protein n=1 Tax=Galactobacillus timonensis TaxID=2041840 RepID=UPI0023F040DA|nr:hypothetical protein [Galactobacillus timonensis]MCI6753364.1 hypothetical protein [Galactobacillus timonensis]MDD7086084.1 hypothetical protein [Galactobacillus timonensis]MDY5221692.1 hypothetical protein [Lachnospiraceae bacterium]
MNDWKKTTDDFTRFVSDTATSFAKLVNDGAKSAADYASVMRQKLELKSQIGEHKRTLNKSYARLGEAYYDASTAGKPVESMDDVLNLIKSNRELIQLLNEKLAALDQQQAQEEKEAAETAASDTAAPSSSTDTTAQETDAAPEEKSEPDTSDSNEIHID